MKTDAIVSAISDGGLPDSDLRRIQCAVAHRIKLNSMLADLAAAGKLRLGMKVGFGNKGMSHGKAAYKEGVIVKVGRTRAVISVNGVRWTAPFSMMRVL